MKKTLIIVKIYFAFLLMNSCNIHGKNASNNEIMLQESAYSPEKNISDTLQSDIQIEYTISKEYPLITSVWKQVFNKKQNEKEISNVNQNETFWIRVSDNESKKWNIYGPLKGSNQYVDITPFEEMETSKEYIQFETNKSTNKEFGCCRIRVRIRVVTKLPRLTLRNATPQITINWQKPIPSVTVKGPDIVISDLPTLPSIDSPIPTDGSTPNIGIDCNIENKEASLYIQNGESKAVDIWINWKGIITGPIRIDANTMRKIGKTGYSDCKTVNDNIFITKAKYTN